MLDALSFFKKLLKIVAIVLAVIAIIYAVYALAAYLSIGTVSGTLTSMWSFGVGWTATQYLVAALTVAAVSAAVSEEGFQQVVEPVIDGVATVSGTVVSAGVDIASEVGGALFSGSSFWLLAGAIGLVALS